MYGLASNLTAMALLAHVVFGCCRHHEHSHPVALGDGGTVHCSCDRSHAHPAGHEHPWGHELADKNGPAGGDGPNRGDCDGGRCMFVAAQPVRMPTTAEEPLQETVAVAATVETGQSAASNFVAIATTASQRCRSLRAHLLNQVLLL